MSKWLFAIVLATLAAPSLSLGAPQEPADAATVRAVQAIAAEFDRASRDRDLNAFLALFEENAVAIPPGAPPLVGKTAIAEWAKAVFGAFAIQGTHEPIESVVQGSLVICRGKATGQLVPTSGEEPVPFDNSYLHVYRRQPDGSLRYWWGAFNADAPPPAVSE